MPKKLSQFWQELKRRNVIRVITIYAGAAFVIIELINNITEPLHLPDWTPTLVIVLLAIGFPLVVIFSWIYDIHPDGGMVKTDPIEKVKSEDIPKHSNSWKIASYISFVVIVGLIILNLVPRSGNKKILDKSIAVLLFVNESATPEDAGFIRGYRTAIHDNLCQIKEIRVLSLSSTEAYGDRNLSIPEISSELGVGYLLAARGQAYGNKLRLIVQLIDSDEEIIWSNPYDRVINTVEDHISIQSEIAQKIAIEIDAIITPDEAELMNKIPTTDLSAYTYWTLGNEEVLKSYSIPLGPFNNKSLESAEELYIKALDLDKTFSEAYAGLASIYIQKHMDAEYYTVNFLDSAKALIDLALTYDKDLASGHRLNGDYYYIIGRPDLALSEYNSALELNPNIWQTYIGLGLIYFNDDLQKELANYHKAAEINRGKGLSEILRLISSAYWRAGFRHESEYYLNQALTLDGDSIKHLWHKSKIVHSVQKYEESIELLWKAYNMDTTEVELLIDLGNNYLDLENYKEALVIFEKYLEAQKNFASMEANNTHRIAYAYWKNGKQEQADYYFDIQLDYSRSDIELGRFWSNLYFSYYDLAGIYAFRGESEKAIEYLREFNEKERQQLWMVNLINNDPLFDSIRNVPEFQQIVRDVEAKYQAEHERVRQWLEENKML